MAYPFGQLPQKAKDIEPFTVSILEKEIQEVNQLLRLSKVAAPTYENTQEDRRYGVTASWLKKAQEFWLEEFDWRKTEEHINSFPNFIATVHQEGINYSIHFIALFSQKQDAVPVISLHGWPGSVLEFLPLLDLVSKAYTSDTLPYHLIIPSLPGYAFSSGPPVDKNFSTMDASAILHRLMTENLGLSAGYVATGGDIGSSVARILAAKYEECQGLQINFCNMPVTPEREAMAPLTEFEKKCVQRGKEFFETGSAYAMEHGTRPSTLGLALQSNPLALLAWISEKFLAWSDEDPSLDTILGDVSLYWFTGTIARCFYPYRQQFEGQTWGHDHPELHVPENKVFGYHLFPKELHPVPRAWVAATGHLTWFRQHESGGHFAALEKPEDMKRDLEDFLVHFREQTR